MLVLGLDIGITSCGWALVDEENQKIVASGVRIFDMAEHPKTGASLAAPRRTARLTRRRLRRRRGRLNRLANSLAWARIVPHNPKVLYPPVRTEGDVWQLRVDALERLLSGEELHRVLHHIGKRRGFPSRKVREVRDDEISAALQSSPKDEEGKALEGVRQLEHAFRESGFRTIGEYLARLPRQEAPENQVENARARKIRNDPSLYQRTILRSLLEEEVAEIFRVQRALGNSTLTHALEREIAGILFSQKPMQSVEHLVGTCSFEGINGDKRAPRSSWSGERFVFLQKVTNLRWWDSETGEERRANRAQIASLIERGMLVGKLTYAHVADILELPRDHEFDGLRYEGKKGARSKGAKGQTNQSDEAPDKGVLRAKENQKQTFFSFSFYHQVKAALSDCANDWNSLNADTELFDEIGRVLSIYKDDNETAERLSELGLQTESVAKLKELSFNSFLSLGFTAMRRMLPFLETGLIYSEAAKKAGYLHYELKKGNESAHLPPFPPLPNPVVNRALSQTRKVVNALIRTYGKPDQVVVELARNLGKSFDERKKIKSENYDRREEKKGLKQKWIKDFKREPTGTDILKARLHAFQRGLCAYSGESIPIQKLIGESAVEIDHIIPFSRSFDDSISNKVLVLTKANREKGSRTPYEWFGEDSERWNRFCAQHQNAPLPKRNKLFAKVIKEDEWKERALNDTRYIAREFLSHVRQNLLPDMPELGRRARATSGGITSLLRYYWGIGQKNRDNHRHHLEDAVLAAMVTPRIQTILTKYFQEKELAGKSGDEGVRGRPLLPLPWESFRHDVRRAADEVFVSRMPRRKVSGTAHEETIQTSRQVAVLGKNGDCVVEQENYKRVELGDKINLKKLENLFDVKRNWKLKQALEERLREYGDDGEKAFKEPFFMPGKKQGTLGARVKSVLIKSGDKSGIQVRGRGPKGFGFAPNGSMIRVDVFREVTGRTSKFHLVPVYAWHFSRAYLPEPEASVSGHINSGASSEPHFQFMFSLHPNEYIEVVDAKDRKASGYFITFDSSDGRIKWAPHDRAGKGNEDGRVKEKKERVATVTAKSIRKFEVDILGNRREVLPGKEPRRGLENRRSRKQGLRPV